MIQRLGPFFLACRRFGVEKNDKVRPIDDIIEFFHNSCISQHALLPVVLDYFLYVLLRCRGQGTGRCMHTEAKTGGILGQRTQVHNFQHLMG